MSTTPNKITLSGDYTSNRQTYSSGSILNLGINGTSITVNGISQSELNLVPNSENVWGNTLPYLRSALDRKK